MQPVVLYNIFGCVLSQIALLLSVREIKNLRNDLFQKMQSLPVRFFDTTNHGEIMSRFTNDVDAIGDMLNNTIAFKITHKTTKNNFIFSFSK